jgi:predicted RNase H-like nuclease
LDVIVQKMAQKHTHRTKRQNFPPIGNKQQRLQKQFQNNDDVIINLTLPTFIIPNLEGVDVPDVVTSSGTKKMTTIDIIAQQETTTDEDGTNNKFKVIRNLWGSTAKNVSTFLSRPSYPID